MGDDDGQRLDQAEGQIETVGGIGKVGELLGQWWHCCPARCGGMGHLGMLELRLASGEIRRLKLKLLLIEGWTDRRGYMWSGRGGCLKEDVLFADFCRADQRVTTPSRALLPAPHKLRRTGTGDRGWGTGGPGGIGVERTPEVDTHEYLLCIRAHMGVGRGSRLKFAVTVWSE